MSFLKRIKIIGFILILALLTAACEQLDDFRVSPQILSFTASPDGSVEAGTEVTLSWNIVGGGEDFPVTLTPGDVSLEKTGSYEVTPSETTRYVLSAGSEGNLSTSALTVEVTGATGVPDEPGNPDEPSNPGEDGKVIEGDVTVTNQAELDELEGVERIEGYFGITTEAETLDFSPLDSLRILGKTLAVYDSPNLKLIEGFPSLVSIGVGASIDVARYLRIRDNPKLTEIKGFEALEEIGYLVVSNNNSLQQFSGFSNLREGAVVISENALLETLPEFESLVSAIYRVGLFGGISIKRNPKLATLDSFNNLRRTNGLVILSNDALTSVTGFSSLLEIGIGADGNDEVGFVIANNNSLTEIRGFDSATNIRGFEIIENPKLKLISGFSSMIRGGNSRQGFSMSDNPELQEISGFDALEVAEPGLRLTNLPKLKSIPSFDALVNQAAISIENTGLTSVAGFNNLTAGGVRISENLALTEMTGFNSFTEAEFSNITITLNPALTQISGFESLEDGSRTTISDNSSFDCSAEPQASLPFLPVQSSESNSVDCPTIDD